MSALLAFDHKDVEAFRPEYEQVRRWSRSRGRRRRRSRRVGREEPAIQDHLLLPPAAAAAAPFSPPRVPQTSDTAATSLSCMSVMVPQADRYFLSEVQSLLRLPSLSSFQADNYLVFSDGLKQVRVQQQRPVGHDHGQPTTLLTMAIDELALSPQPLCVAVVSPSVPQGW